MSYTKDSILFIKSLICINTLLHINLTDGAPSTLASLTENKPAPNYNIKSLAANKNDETFITRQHDGDIFSTKDLSKCFQDTCVGLSSGTASLLTTQSSKIDAPKIDDSDTVLNSNSCACRCHSYLSTYREDLGICVDDIRECTLSPFISGSSSEKIPFVFLPLRGQIIYPSREIKFADINTPVCAVTGSQYLTSNGWADLRNPTDTDLPFRMFRDEGRTFLQWLGEPELRQKMQGRLLLIHLMCRDMSFAGDKNSVSNELNLNTNNIYTPCVAFRINGSPVKYFNNVSEVLFQSEASVNLPGPTDTLSTREYIVIAVCSLLLGLIYVSSVFLYLHAKKRKISSSEPARSSIDELEHNINYPQNDQVTFGIPFTRSGSSYSLDNNNDHMNNERSHSRNIILPGEPLKDDIGIIKNNPLLKHCSSLSDNSGFSSDMSNSNSEYDEKIPNKNDKSHILRKKQTSVVVHPTTVNENEIQKDENVFPESSSSPTQEVECLPEANVSIIEECDTDEKQFEHMRALVNGTVRKKLYFNPAYFEPHLLLSPPQAAIEFLTKIREVIAIAKYKMASKRYQPTLGAILEEFGSSTSEKRKTNSAKREFNGLKSENLVQQQPLEKNQETTSNSNSDNMATYNFGEKTNSIHKWLETVSPALERHTTPLHIKNVKSQILADEEVPNIWVADISNDEKRDGNRDRDVEKMCSLKITSQTTAETAEKNKFGLNTQISSMKTQANVVEIDGVNPKLEFSKTSTTRPLLSQNYAEKNPMHQHTDPHVEIYNNPKFSHLDSPQLSQKSSVRNKSSKKRIEVLDQYANPKNLEVSNYELMKNIKQMPDMIYEAIAKDYSLIVESSSSASNSQTLNIPTPDYDETFDRKIQSLFRAQYLENSFSAKRNHGKGNQPPDSPIYRRKSPQYLIVDYETDSLERSTQNRKFTSSSSPTSNNSSEVSSQPSPSLSTALPLEEEVEIRHTVYDKVEGFRKDGDFNLKKKTYSSKLGTKYEDVSLKSEQSSAPMIKYDTPFRGSMTIEVKHEPLSDFEPSTDSDQFEPDTLDRKPKKHSFCDVKSNDAWSEHLNKSKRFVNSLEEKICYSSLENMSSLPDFTIGHEGNYDIKNCLVLKSSSSFRSNIESLNKRVNYEYNEADKKLLENRPLFGSLREIYQSKATRNQHERPKLKNVDFFSENGRLLTLEAKHSRRQRQIEREDNKHKVLPPDVVPKSVVSYIPNSCSKPSIRKEDRTTNKEVVTNSPKIVHTDQFVNISTNNKRKNFRGWNIDNFSGIHGDGGFEYAKPKLERESKRDGNDTLYDETEETISNHSESTEITGVSDTQANSEFEEDNVLKTRTNKSRNQEYQNKSEEQWFMSLLTKDNGDDELQNDSNIERSAILSLKDKNIFLSSVNNYEIDFNRGNEHDEENKSSLKCEELPETKNEMLLESKTYSQNTNNDHNSGIKQVYHVKVVSPANGMHIAFDIKSKSKKSKDIKNAWKRFVCLATSKLSSSITKSNDLPVDDEKITKTIDNESIKILHSQKRLLDNGNGQLSPNFSKNETGCTTSREGLLLVDPNVANVQYKNELDSGYMSADSNEMYARRYYDRFTFKKMSDISILQPTVEENNSNMMEYRDIYKTFDIKSDRDTDSNVKSNSSIDVRLNNFDYSNQYEIEGEKCDKKHVREEHEALATSESDDDGGNTEDLSESGAESVETHSVFFKNIRKTSR